MGYSNNEKNENNGFSYNLMLKNIPYHIKGGLKRTPIMPAHPRTHLYRKIPPPPGAEQHTNGTAEEYWFNFILIATNTQIWKQKIHNIQDLTKSRRLVLRSSPGMENIGNTWSKNILRKHTLKLGFTYKKSQTNWKLLKEETSSSAESNIYGRFVISQ